MAKILLVDDEYEIALVIRHLLAESGYEICVAQNGLAALLLFESQFFDLIITDLRMPRMDGMSFLCEVRKLEPSTPVIILTAYDSPETAAQAVENGALIYLTKPFKSDKLLDIVNRLLRADRSMVCSG